jgi:formylglycine-generating enzyme required for sulfatase activity/alpha-tubulin suppressor-like RCC1 family protein
MRGTAFALVLIALAPSACRKRAPSAAADAGAGSLAVGHGHSCLLRADRSIWCWGSNRLGSVGVKSRQPTQQYQPTAVRVKIPAAKQVAIASVQTCFEAEAGGTSCWGGRLSDDDASPQPLMIAGSQRLVSGTAGCALDAGGTATCWGEDANGRLSPGDRDAVRAVFGAKVALRALNTGTPLADIAVGDRHTCALARDGRVLCWGLNNFGQIALGSEVQELAEPRAVEGLAGVKQIASGSFHSCALDGDGAVWCWGRGDDGQLGIGEVKPPNEFSDKSYSPKPTGVEGLDSVRRIAAGASQTCAITGDGALFCWGANDDGQIGNGTAEDARAPSRVRGLENVAEVGIGYSHACARLASDDVYCWGDGDDGRLGNGGIEGSAEPVQVRFGTERTGPDPSQSALVEHESLACGFQVELPGPRNYAELRDLVTDRIGVASAPPSRFEAHCFPLAKSADKSPADIEKRLAADLPGARVSRRTVDGVSCVEVRESKPELHRFTSYCFADAADEKRAAGVLGSLHFFDPKTRVAAAGEPAPPAPPGMVVVPAGEFAMGCANQSLFDKPTGELGCIERSQPLHRVYLSAYAIDVREVSIAEYDACVTAGKCRAVEGPDVPRIDREPDKPASFVDWEQAKSYCEWKGKRLPTEAEWEKAARGTDGRKRPWGDTPGTCEQSVLLSCNGPTAVGTHPAGKSPYGALDMSGNVMEWVSDRFGVHYFLNSPRKDPPGPESGVQRTVKGSSRMTAPGSDLTHWRHGKAPSHRDPEIGFRCAQSLGSDSQQAGAKSRCGCTVPGSREHHPEALAWLSVLAAMAIRRRPRRGGGVTAARPP